MFGDVVDEWRSEENGQDFRCLEGTIEMILLQESILSHARDVYTLEIFKLFQEQYLKDELSSDPRTILDPPRSRHKGQRNTRKRSIVEKQCKIVKGRRSKSQNVASNSKAVAQSVVQRFVSKKKLRRTCLIQKKCRARLFQKVNFWISKRRKCKTSGVESITAGGKRWEKGSVGLCAHFFN
ncbi:unnamed protein product [Cuscuta europaea]|uniref:Uncharacterized protein n=1 Tax=Cuscuta europaea TaxID=41803 RepID=A0A9P1E448_CUSEU|nr:unnamed protein product [Cuscuta europaea]